MGNQISPQKSLVQRLDGLVRPGVLRGNPADAPFWIPEENPLLLAWDMTLNEYCQSVQRVVGLYPGSTCRQIFCEIWPELDDSGWDISLIALLGRAWRLLHPERRLQDAEDVLQETMVWNHWDTGPAVTTGTLRDRRALSEAIAGLILMPFARMEQREKAGIARRKEDMS